jgi:plasmid segregation protein ParM
LTPVIALDVGHSAVKVVADSSHGRASIVFPSVVTGAIELMEGTARKAAERETVEVDGRRFFFGETAVTQGAADSESGLSENWITTAPYSALVSGAFLKLAQLPDMISVDGAIIVVGLPAKYIKAQSPLLTQVMKKLAPTADIIVLPQPLGPFMTIQFDDQGVESKNHKIAAEAWGIIEVGHYTTDFGVVRNGLWVDRNAGSCHGAHVVVERVAQLIKEQRGHSMTLIETTKAIVDGRFMEFGEQVDIAPFVDASKQVLIDDVVDTIDRLLDRDARSLNGIVLAGGAAKLLLPTVQAKYKHAFMADNSRLTVAEGFYRAGSALRNDRRKKAARAKAADAEAVAGATAD